MVMKKGAKVEVMREEADWKDVYLPARIVKSPDRQGWCFVLLDQYKNWNIDQPLEQMYMVTQIRPKPIFLDIKRYVVGDVVDAYHLHNAWWKGVVVDFVGGTYSVWFERLDMIKGFSYEELRLHQDWVKKDDNTSGWNYDRKDPDIPDDSDEDMSD